MAEHQSDIKPSYSIAFSGGTVDDVLTELAQKRNVTKAVVLKRALERYDQMEPAQKRISYEGSEPECEIPQIPSDGPLLHY